MQRLVVTLIVILFCLPTTALAADAPKDNYLVGVYYFSGWWRETPNKWMTQGKDWRKDFPERIPTLGEYNEQKTMDAEILAAASHSVDFFQFLWYPLDENAKPAEPHANKLNNGVNQFLTSAYADKMHFTVEYVNHPPFLLATDEQWAQGCRTWCAMMKHPSYLRVDGRAVIKIHSLNHLLHVECKGDTKRVNARIETLRQTARDMGVGELLVCGGVNPDLVPRPPATAPYDFLTTYMDMPNLPRRVERWPYERLLHFAEATWVIFAGKADKPYVPFLPSGWDPEPWKDTRAPYGFPDRQQWTDALQSVKAALDTYENLGIPRRDGTLQKAFLIYAWNEFGEGGFIAPTQGRGTMMLDCIQDVFGK